MECKCKFKFNRILQEKRNIKQNVSIKLRNGLQRIDDINHKIHDMTTDLEKITELLTKHSKECEDIISIIPKYIKEIETQKIEIDTINIIIKKDELKCQEINDIALAELKLSICELEEATNVNNLNNLKTNLITKHLC